MFTEIEKKRIAEAVSKAEKKTSGEIVVMAVGSSSRYRWVHFATTLVGFVVSIPAICLLEIARDWSVPVWEIFTVQLIFAMSGGALALIPAFKRLLIPQNHQRTTVHRECLASFISRGLTETKLRNGILIYLSAFEKRVEILADKGIHEKCGVDFWKAEVTKISSGLHEKDHAKNLEQVIEEIGQKLAEHFPSSKSNPNELSNQVLTED